MKKLHKVTGIALALIMVWMGFSGVVLNHRKQFSEMDVSRHYLPGDYAYDNWNYGFIKGSLRLSADSVFLYGGEGVWLTDSAPASLIECNAGLHPGADNLKVMRMASTPDGTVYCATLYHLYHYHTNSHKWEEVLLPGDVGRIADLEIRGDTVVLLTRSELIVKAGVSADFKRAALKASPDRTGKRSLFRIIWKLHSGELLGTVGKLVVDGFAVLLTFLSITGLLIWLLPKSIRRNKRRKHTVGRQVSSLRFSWKWHNKLGYWFTIPLLILVITGTFLRPPLLIAIAKAEVTPPPLTTMSTENSWHDQLRVIRYDHFQGEWVLYTSDGFYTLAELDAAPRKVAVQPPVSVMGVNVLQQVDADHWLIGSFTGLNRWNPKSGECVDCFTGEAVKPITGMPFGQRKISGYSSDLGSPIAFDYDKGATAVDGKLLTFPDMPSEHACRPMSLWNLALEMHTGRVLTFLGMGNVLFVFVVGVTSFLMIFSGWKLVWKRKRKK